MTKKLLFTAIALFAGAFAHAGVVRTNNLASFTAPTVELFGGDSVQVPTYDFLNGMTYENMAGEADLINFDGSFIPNENGFAITSGLDWDKYFQTANSPTTFQFKFAGGTTRFGFYGTEAVFGDSGDVRDGFMDLEFYGLNGDLLESMTVDTNVENFYWEDFYGFESNSGAIGRVVFRNVGNMVLDNVAFEQAATAAVPEPASIALLGLGLAGFAVARRKPARK